MSKTITIQVNKSAVVEAIKGDTSITGNVDRSVDAVKNAGVAYNEQAGDDAHHLKKIDLLIRTAISKFAAEMASFADGSAGSVSTTVGDTITITLKVSDRYMSGLADPLAGIAQSYIVNMALYGWWISIKPEFAKGFAAMAADALVYVHKCFAKAAPATSPSAYSDVTGTATDGRTAVEIYFDVEDGTIRMDEQSKSFAATTSPAGLPLTYSSNSPLVATVNSNSGVVTPQSVGTAIITATYAGNSEYFPATAQLTIHVMAARTTPTITVSSGLVQAFEKGGTYDFTYLSLPSNLPCDWSVTGVSADTQLIGAQNKLRVKFNEAGTATIRASFPGNDDYNAASGTLQVTVKDKVEFISPQSGLNTFIETEGTYQINAVTVPANVPLTYTSSNTQVATVSATGLVTAGNIANSSATITISCADTELYNGDQVQITVRVTGDITPPR